MKKLKHDKKPSVRPVPEKEVCEACGLNWGWHKYATPWECIRLLRRQLQVTSTTSCATLSSAFPRCSFTTTGANTGISFGRGIWHQT